MPDQWLGFRFDQLENEKELTYQRWRWAENVFRACDKLGFLVREGRVPVDIIAKFYVMPILRAWYNLSPYIRRVRDARHQPSHGWEFENLVFGIILPNLGIYSGHVSVSAAEGVWKGGAQHDLVDNNDNLPDWVTAMFEEHISAQKVHAPWDNSRVWEWAGSLPDSIQRQFDEKW